METIAPYSNARLKIYAPPTEYGILNTEYLPPKKAYPARAWKHRAGFLKL